MESDSAQATRGLVYLSYLPSRFGDSQPFLAGWSLAKLADWCDATGESAAAASLRHELMTRFPLYSSSARQRVPAGAVSHFQSFKETP
jgi:hypothetical protein